MSPERTQGNQFVDQRSDIYGLGATLYTLLTGKPPCDGRTLPDMIANIRRAKPRGPRNFQSSIPELLERVVEKMLAKQPEDRYQTPESLLVDLGRIAAAEGVEI